MNRPHWITRIVFLAGNPDVVDGWIAGLAVAAAGFIALLLLTGN